MSEFSLLPFLPILTRVLLIPTRVLLILTKASPILTRALLILTKASPILTKALPILTKASPILLVSLALGMGGCSRKQTPLLEVSYRGRAMGTIVEVSLRHTDPEKSKAAIEQITATFTHYETLLSAYDPDSHVSRINRDAARTPVQIPDELFHLIAESLRLSALTQGAFDITYASIGHLYQFKTQQHPDEQQIQALLPAVNYQLIELDPSRRCFFIIRICRLILGESPKGMW
jgi:thiamine biosynthesis lipoprotein ApbE